MGLENYSHPPGDACGCRTGIDHSPRGKHWGVKRCRKACGRGDDYLVKPFHPEELVYAVPRPCLRRSPMGLNPNPLLQRVVGAGWRSGNRWSWQRAGKGFNCQARIQAAALFHVAPRPVLSQNTPRRAFNTNNESERELQRYRRCKINHLRARLGAVTVLKRCVARAYSFAAEPSGKALGRSFRPGW